jgi:homoserine dehydrogenase
VYDSQLIVLKFGGSVLLDEQRLRIAVHEIYRWRRVGWRVIAVVSAFAGRTEELIARSELLSVSSSNLSKACLIASGEIESASFLGIHLDRAGLTAMVLSPASAELVAIGDPLDANPVSIDHAKINQALDDVGIVVIPGFVAINESGATVTLGRGGSDLTAVYLAHGLQADRCRLIKDVDGLYERDPSQSSPPPRRFKCASYADALRTDGSIIQYKAIKFAQRKSVEIELGRFNGVSPTRIGTHLTSFDDRRYDLEPTTVAVCGLGTVGRGVLELIDQLPELFTIVGAACQTPSKHDDLISLAGMITDDAISLAGSETDVVIELIGGVDIAWEVTKKAINTGSYVINANKSLIADCGPEIFERAQDASLSVRYSASVGGVAPIIEAINIYDAAHSINPIRSVHGVLNGTGNFVLGSFARGESLGDSILKAQQLGFAEADPSGDLDGRDSLDKLLVIAQQLGWEIDQVNISLGSITQWAQHGGDVGHPVRHIARLDANSASVRVESVDPNNIDDPLGQLENEWNAAVIEFADGSTQVIKGKGAGRWPTSESVFADLLELRRTLVLEAMKGSIAYV